MTFKQKYFKTLRARAQTSKVYTNYQLDGLEIARILQDERHKSLYIKLAKEGDSRLLWQYAREIAERKDIHNKGAYFMSLVKKRISTNHGKR